MVSEKTQQASLSGIALPDTNPSKTATALYEFDFVPASQVIGINITYKAVMWSAVPVFGTLNKNVKLMNTNRNVATIILDRHGAVFRRVAPEEDIVLSTAEILFLASYHLDDYGLLSNLQDATRLNMQPANVQDVYGSRTHFPTWVFGSGAEVRAGLECFNDDFDAFAAGFGNIGASLESPACVLKWQLFELSANVREAEPLSGTGIGGSKVSSGVRIMTAENNHGTFRAWDGNKILLQFTSLMVLLKIPTSFIAFVVVTLLGHLSGIYRRTTEHRFNIVEQFSTSAFQAIQNSMLFEHFADASDGDSQTPNALSKTKLQSLLLKIARSSNITMTEEDVCFMTEFCVQSIAGPNEDRINFSQFQEALLRNDAMGLSNAFKMFAQNRKKWPLERAFTPPLFSQIRKSASLDVKVKVMEHETPQGRDEGIPDSSRESEALNEASWVTELRRSHMECELKLEKLAADVQFLQQAHWESQAQQIKGEQMDARPTISTMHGPPGSGCQADARCNETSRDQLEQNVADAAKESNEGISPEDHFLCSQLQRTQEACDQMLQRFNSFMESTQRSLDELKSQAARDEGSLAAKYCKQVEPIPEKKAESHREQSSCEQDMTSNDHMKQLEMELQGFQNRLREFEVKQGSMSLTASPGTDLPDKVSKLEKSIAVILEKLDLSHNNQSSSLLGSGPQESLRRTASRNRGDTGGVAGCLRRNC